MVKTILFAVFFLTLCCVAGRAQSLTATSTFATQQGSSQQELAPPIGLKNNSNRTQDFRWEITRQNLPEGWEFAVCDKQCHSFTESRIFSLAANESLADFRVVFRPNGNPGIGNVEVRILDAQNHETNLTFTASAQGSAASRLQSKLGAQRVYPNPATEYIMLQDEDDAVKILEVYSVVGRKVLEFPVTYSGEKFDVSSLPRGMYMVRMLDTHRNIIRTQRISKYNP